MGNNYMGTPSVVIHREVITSKAQKRILVFVLLFFAVASVYIALNLAEGIIPDEEAHFFIFSKVYASTWGLSLIGESFINHPNIVSINGKCNRIDENDVETDRLFATYKNIWLRVLGYHSLLI